MEQTKKTVKHTFYERFRAQTPRILACCYFGGGVLIALLILLGITTYGGELVSISNCLDWIIDFGNIETERLLYYGARAALGILYMIYVIRVIKQILQGLNSFLWVMKAKGDEYSRAQSVVSLNLRFGNICGLAAMHLVWAYLFDSSFSLSHGSAVAIIGGMIFTVTGVILNYSYEKPNAPAYVAVDTARNLLALVIVMLLMSLMECAALENLYNGILQTVNYGESIERGFQQFDVKNTVYMVYDKLCSPILHMILWLGSVSAIKQIAGDFCYFEKRTQRKGLLSKFNRICVFSAVLAVVSCLINAMCRGLELRSVLPAALDTYLPLILLGLAGTMLFRFSYPEKHARSRKVAEAQVVGVADETEFPIESVDADTEGERE